jgi:pimeloyl-ACP methyl ester carboxylesterase
MRPHNEPNVVVECLTCGHIGVLTREALSRFSIQANRPIAAFVKRLRCRRCGSHAHGVSPVVMLHGASANLGDMRLALAERFGGRRQVVFIDRPGMGFSARGGKEGASPAYQAAVLRSLRPFCSRRNPVLCF